MVKNNWRPYLVPTFAERLENEAKKPDDGEVEAWWFAAEIRVHREWQGKLERRRRARAEKAAALRAALESVDDSWVEEAEALAG